jgi:hypothetical protein
MSADILVTFPQAECHPHTDYAPSVGYGYDTTPHCANHSSLRRTAKLPNCLFIPLAVLSSVFSFIMFKTKDIWATPSKPRKQNVLVDDKDRYYFPSIGQSSTFPNETSSTFYEHRRPLAAGPPRSYKADVRSQGPTTSLLAAHHYEPTRQPGQAVANPKPILKQTRISLAHSRAFILFFLQPWH